MAKSVYSKQVENTTSQLLLVLEDVLHIDKGSFLDLQRTFYIPLGYFP